MVDEGLVDTETGERIIRVSQIATAVFALSAVGAVITSALRPLASFVSLALFGLGVVVFLYAYVVSLGRSVDYAVTVPGVFFLSGTAPKRVRRMLIGLLVIQMVIAVVTASLRPFSSLAFGILVPMFGVAQCGLWGARHGQFAPRVPKKQ